MDIGDRIRKIRGRHSRAEFAEELGIHPQTLYMYEKGKRVVDVELVRGICEKFNVSVEWLIFGDRELQSLRETPVLEGEAAYPAERADKPDVAPVIAEKDARIEELKSELIAAQAGALKAYELAVEVIQQGAESGLRKNAKSPLRGWAKETAPKEARSK
ncbi:MAG: helix-turn-helix domain-containing protein [Candidatus Adiutrix sp.]|jgi:transcriptional regulator with XRE-family HTH domain|nr:helix-turn-helix domain-containing protein [Candidatus Adiutrix sp.]